MNKKAVLVLSLVLIALLLLIHSNQNYALSAKSKKDLSDSSPSILPNKSKGIIDRKQPLQNNTTLPINPTTPGKVIVTKNVINQGGGTGGKPSDFTISVSGNNPSPPSFSGSADGITVQLRAGKYSVIETGPLSGYITDYSGECSGIASPDIINECTITNTYQPPPPPPSAKLIVIKNVINKDFL